MARRLFDAFVVVVPEWRSTEGKWAPKLDACLPSTIRGSLPKKIESFCFPDIDRFNSKNQATMTMSSSEEFTFVLTEEDGSRRFGFCRRSLRTEKAKHARFDVHPRLPETLCFLSSYPYFSIFSALLKTIQIRRWLTPTAVAPLLRDAYQAALPAQSSAFSVQSLVFFRPVEERISASWSGINCLLSHFSSKKLRYIITAVLCEFRIIFFSSSLERLSKCIHTLLSLCYPFVWSHILVPYLPSDLLDYVCAPSPYLLGVSTDDAKTVEKMPVGEALYVDIERGTLRATSGTPDIVPIGEAATTEYGRRGSATSANTHLARALDAVYSKAINVGEKTRLRFDPGQVSQCFLVFFLQIFHNYREFLSAAMGGHRKISFDEERFVAYFAGDDRMQAFLTVFLRTNAFDAFLQSRCSANRSDDLPAAFDVVGNSAPKLGMFDEQSHIIEMQPGDSSYRSIQKSVQSMFDGEANGTSLKTTHVRNILLDITSNKSTKRSLSDSLAELARASFEATCQPLCMELLWRRMADSKGTDWRHGYKSLCILEYLLRQGSEATIADILDHARILYTFTSFRANEKKDAVVLKALNALSMYDGNDKGRGNRVRTQAAWVYRLANDCLLMRTVRIRWVNSSKSGSSSSAAAVPRIPELRLYTLQVHGGGGAAVESKPRSGSLFKQFKKGVKEVKKHVKEVKKQLKSGRRGSTLKKNERIVVDAPDFKYFHQLCKGKYGGPVMEPRPYRPERPKVWKKKEEAYEAERRRRFSLLAINSQKKPKRAPGRPPATMGSLVATEKSANSFEADLLGLDFGTGPLNGSAPAAAPASSGVLIFSSNSNAEGSDMLGSLGACKSTKMDDPFDLGGLSLPPAIPARPPRRPPKPSGKEEFDPFNANDVANAFG
jgi:hypothetical protein